MERPQNFQFDTRIRRRIQAKGLITQEQVDAHLRSLPDREGHFVVLDVSQPAVSPAPVSTPPGPPPAAEPAVAPAAPFGGGLERFAPAAVPSSTTFAADEDEAPLTPVMLSPRDLAASLARQEAPAAEAEKEVDEGWAADSDDEAPSSPDSEPSEEETDKSEETP